MSLVIEQTQPVPLAQDLDGVVRVAGMRVTLDTVVAAFERGATAEEIAQQYPILGLADVYAVIGYLLRHQSEVAAYLATRTMQREEVREENERRTAPAGIRARLLARRVMVQRMPSARLQDLSPPLRLPNEKEVAGARARE